MPIRYLRYAGSHLAHVLCDSDDLTGVRVLVFDPVLEEQRAVPLGDRFRRLDIALRDADAVFLRGSTALSLNSSDDLRSLVVADSTFRDLTRESLVGLLDVRGLADATPSMQVDIVQPGATDVLNTLEWLPILQRAEFLAFLAHREALLSGHFALPSGVHADKFLAVRRLLGDATTISRIADWLIGDLRGITGILTDQPPMLPLAYALQGLAARVFGSYPFIHVLEEYPADVMTLVDAIYTIGEELGEQRRLLFLLSLTNSGRLLNYWRSAAPPTSAVRILFSTASDPQIAEETDCLLAIPIPQHSVSPQGTCELCVGDDIALYRIDMKTFEPQLQQTPFQLIKPNRERLVRSARFWGIVDEVDAVRLHHFDEEHHRHHPIYLDISRLLSHREFRDRSLDALQHLRIVEEYGTTPELILIPKHSASGVIADLTREAFPSAQIEFLPEGTMRIPDSLRPRIASKRYILVADDALITARTLIDLKFELYYIVRSLERPLVLDFFVVVARPTGSLPLQQLRNRLRDMTGAHLHYAYEVFLPYPHKSFCPLCVEQSRLEHFMPQLTERAAEVALTRLRTLQGHVDDPFPNTAAGRRIVGSFMLSDATGGSASALRRTVFAATQAAAMILRDEVDVLQSKGEYGKVDVADILSKYYDPEILAGFFRTIGLNYLSWPGAPEAVEKLVYEFTANEASREAFLELGWAVFLGRLPAHPIFEQLADLGDDAASQLIRELIALNIIGRRP